MAKNYSGALLAIGVVLALIAAYFFFNAFAITPDDGTGAAALYYQGLALQLAVGAGIASSIFICAGAIAAQMNRQD